VDNYFLNKPLAFGSIIPYYMDVMYRPPNDRQPDTQSKPVTVLGSYDDALSVAKEIAKEPTFQGKSTEFVIYPLPPAKDNHPYRTSYRVQVNGWYDLPF
jgi:hypothetical protein